jgi:hypothetical protein
MYIFKQIAHLVLGFRKQSALNRMRHASTVKLAGMLVWLNNRAQLSYTNKTSDTIFTEGNTSTNT